MSLIHSRSKDQAQAVSADIAPGRVAGFLRMLHDDPIEAGSGAAGTSPADWPRPFAAREGGPRIRLSGARLPWAPGPLPVPGSAAWLGELLITTAGCCRVRYSPAGAQHNSPEHPHPVNRRLTMEVRRAIASGGGMYPGEVYAIPEGIDGLAVGVYRFDAARHELAFLAAAPEPGRVAAALSRPASQPFLTLIITCRFVKSTAKYGSFAYRLASVDTGVVVGRLCAQLAACGLRARLHFDFDDAAVDHMVRATGREEGTYAVITVAPPPSLPPFTSSGRPPWPSAESRPRRSGMVGVGRAGRLPLPPDLAAAHQAARATRYQPLGPTGAALPAAAGPALPSAEGSPCPAAPVSSATIARRRSDGALFDGRPATRAQLASVLDGAVAGLRCLRATCADGDLPAVAIGVAVHRVAGFPVGVYVLGCEDPTPRSVRAGDTSELLQETLHAGNVNIRLAAFTVHVLGRDHPTSGPWGVRGYRVAQLLAGAVTDAVTLAAATAGLSAHAMLGFRGQDVALIYNAAVGRLSPLIQIPVGSTRPGLRLESSVTE